VKGWKWLIPGAVTVITKFAASLSASKSRKSAAKANYSCAAGGLALLAIFTGLGGSSRAVADENVCDARLTVELSPSVPRAGDDGFISSLLNNHFAYHLELLRQDDSSTIEVDLSGPGPSYRCQNVIESMRKDARVESIRVAST
jgi:hypothetical protein